jgi:hypothetical protein
MTTERDFLKILGSLNDDPALQRPKRDILAALHAETEARATLRGEVRRADQKLSGFLGKHVTIRSAEWYMLSSSEPERYSYQAGSFGSQHVGLLDGFKILDERIVIGLPAENFIDPARFCLNLVRQEGEILIPTNMVTGIEQHDEASTLAHQ